MNDTNMEKAKKKTPRNRPGKALELSPELLEFVNSAVSTTEIAARYGISPATLTMRAKRAGLPLRQRGVIPQRNRVHCRNKSLRLPPFMVAKCQPCGSA